MPGVLPVVNQRAVEYGLRVALALDCQINPTSIFARKNYFYPDLPKGYQISQYEQPLARNGPLTILTSQGERLVRIRRVHLEEDTGKLTHVSTGDGSLTRWSTSTGQGCRCSRSSPSRTCTPLKRCALYATALRSLLRYLGVNSGDMQKGVMRIEPNISVRPRGSTELGTRTEIKNLNSFRALERSVEYEIQRQVGLLRRGRARGPGDRRLGRRAQASPSRSASRSPKTTTVTFRSRTCRPWCSIRTGSSRCVSRCRSCPSPACTASRGSTA